MKRIHFAADGITVDNVSLVEVGANPEAGAIDVDDDAYVGPGMVRDGDGFAWPVAPIGAGDVDARAAAAFQRGFAPDHADFAGERLQVRDMDDRTNWLTSQASYAAAVAAGAGDIVDATFRTAANRTLTVSYGEGLVILLGMAAWGRTIMARSWALKDALAAGEPVDLEAGWPA